MPHRDVLVDGKYMESVFFVKGSCHKICGSETQIIAVFFSGGVFSRANQHRAEAVMAILTVYPKLGKHRSAPCMNVHDAAADDIFIFILHFENKLFFLCVRFRLLVALILYVVSPVDLMPGPVDDIILCLAYIIANRKRLNNNRFDFTNKTDFVHCVSSILFLIDI